ncbi:MAG: sulfite exporter TauE/SafE family protein [Paracoccus sp. (in: a-proteobacteria)]|uniref:sulfite exporter TauE/SafE family protein n=1 Tax=Paracoccus sp. TaxID=267 RepID=UPI00391871DE
MPELTPEAWILAILAASAIGLAKGGLALVAVIAVPILSLVMSPVQAAGLLLPVYVVSDIGGLLVYRRHVDRAVLRSALPGAVIGIGVGWATAHLVPVQGVTLIVGVIGLVFALNALRPKPPPPPRPVSAARGNSWGVLAGYTSFVSHSGGPPWQIYAQPLRLPSLVFAGTTTWFFAIVNWVKLLPYAALGQLSPDNLAIAAVLTPVALVSVWLGLRLVRVIPQALFYRLITWGLLIVSVRLVWQGVAG